METENSETCKFVNLKNTCSKVCHEKFSSTKIRKLEKENCTKNLKNTNVKGFKKHFMTCLFILKY